MAETKERTALAWPDSVDDPAAKPSHEEQHAELSRAAALAAARAALAAEWQAANPKTPDDISRFYERAEGIAADLEAWHRTPERQEWTRMLVHVATQASGDRRQATEGPFRVVDIGCGAGHDLLALREALPDATLCGVEPNQALADAYHAHGRRELREDGGGPYRSLGCVADVSYASIEDADLLICIDVLEHVPDPESFLGSIAQRAPIGCLLFETTATHDTGTPLHLVANRGWHPGRVLERYGWELADQTGRVRVWRRAGEAGAQRASLLLCAYRSVSLPTLQSILSLCAGAPSDRGNRWRLKAKGGDALIARSRSIILTDWWRSTADDVCLLVDDDVVFSAADADRLVELCRGGYHIICGAYPVHDGAHLACRFLPGTEDVSFGPGQPPIEIQYAATGCVALSRQLVDTLVKDQPLCHAEHVWSFHHLFPSMVVEDAVSGGHALLSEDYGLSELARQAGFKVWMDPQTRLEHRGEASISVQNMAAMKAAIAQV